MVEVFQPTIQLLHWQIKCTVSKVYISNNATKRNKTRQNLAKLLFVTSGQVHSTVSHSFWSRN